MFLLAGATAVALGPGCAPVTYASDDPANRGWSAPVGHADEFAQTSGDD